MNLYITSTPTDSMTGVTLAPELLNTNMAHLVIASNKWDAAYIEVSETIQQGRLQMIPTVCNKIYPRVPELPNRHEMILLTELFPALSGSIRKVFMKGDSVYGILPQVWEQGVSAGGDSMQL